VDECLASLLWAPAPGNIMGLANTPQDYTGGLLATSPCQQSQSPDDGAVFASAQRETAAADLSDGSEQESGIADVDDFNSRLSEEGTREADPGEAAYSAA